MKNRLFAQTRWRLALWYAGAMGAILSLLGLGVYHAIAHAHLAALQRELKAVAGTLHDSLELKLPQPGKIDPIVYQLLPNLCIIGSSCPHQRENSDRHILTAISQNSYYVRLYDTEKRLVAIAGTAANQLPPQLNLALWQTLFNRQGQTYRQISLLLHDRQQQDWGYLQVGRSLQDLENYLDGVRWALIFGTLAALIPVGLASWWLAGLAMQPIYQSYSQIEQFSADVAHELRTPLAAMQATVESALQLPDLSAAEAAEVLQSADRQNRRLIQLVNDLLLLAKMDRQAVPMRRQVCYLPDLVSDLVEEFAALAIAAEVELTATIQAVQPVAVSGDEDQLYRLVANLIVNGIQYTPAGGKVAVILDCKDSAAIIQVKDTGIGIAPEEQKLIFHRFYRASSDRSRQTGGAGLGLAIAKAIAEMHQGSLQVQSIFGAGTTFTIRLPAIAT